MAYAIIPYYRMANPIRAYKHCPDTTWVTLNDADVRMRFAALPFVSGDVNHYETPGKQFTRLTGYPQSLVPASGLTAIISNSADPVLETPFTWKEKERAVSSYKAFKAAQEKGLIVLNPMKAVKLTMEDKPVLKKGTRLARDTTGEVISRVHTQTIACEDHPIPAYEIPHLGIPVPLASLTNGYYPLSKIGYDLYENAELVSLFRDIGRPPVELFLSRLNHLSHKGSLVNAARADINEGVYNLMLDVAEAQETVSFLMSTFRTILKHGKTAVFKERRVKAAIQLKRKLGKLTPDDVAKATTSIAGIWMAFRYAVTPLVMSIKDIHEYVSKPHPRFTSVRKRADEDITEEIGGWTFTATVEHRCFAKAAVDVDSKYAGLGMNPIHTLWDKTPYSFVIDWVLPIGDFLMGSFEPSWISHSASSYSFKCKELKVSHPQYGDVKCDIEYYRTFVLGNQLELDFSPNVSMSWKRWIDAFALSWFQTSRFFRR